MANRMGRRVTGFAAATVLGVGLLTALPAAAYAQGSGEVRDLVYEVRDLTYATEAVDGSTGETRTGDQVEVRLSADVFFAFDSAKLNSKAKDKLDELATRLKEQATGTVNITGHTDSKGTEEYNLKLSKQRAEAVREALESRLGGSGLTLVAEGKGEAEPIAPNENEDGSDNPEGRAKNRRVEIRFQLG